MNEPLDHLIFHHGRKPLGDQLAPPLGILIERFLALIFYPLKNYAVRSYLSIEPVILQECISHLSKARGLFQSHIPCGCGTNQAIKGNLVEQRMIISTGCHLPTKHVQMGTRISNAIFIKNMHRWAQGSPVPSYLANSSALNLGGIVTQGKLIRLSRSTLSQMSEPSMIRIFSVRIST